MSKLTDYIDIISINLKYYNKSSHKLILNLFINQCITKIKENLLILEGNNNTKKGSKKRIIDINNNNANLENELF